MDGGGSYIGRQAEQGSGAVVGKEENSRVCVE